jgi:ferritin
VPAETFVAALNDQITMEFAAAHQYTSIAAFYELATFPQLAKFFQAQADEERGHAMKMVDYLVDTNSQVELGAIPAPSNHFPDHVEPIKLAVEQESKVTVSISSLYDVALETKDHQSAQFLLWFLEEQVEEEDTMQDVLEVAERTRDASMLLEEYMAREQNG